MADIKMRHVSPIKIVIKSRVQRSQQAKHAKQPLHGEYNHFPTLAPHPMASYSLNPNQLNSSLRFHNSSKLKKSASIQGLSRQHAELCIEGPNACQVKLQPRMRFNLLSTSFCEDDLVADSPIVRKLQFLPRQPLQSRTPGLARTASSLVSQSTGFNKLCCKRKKNPKLTASLHNVLKRYFHATGKNALRKARAQALTTEPGTNPDCSLLVVRPMLLQIRSQHTRKNTLSSLRPCTQDQRRSRASLHPFSQYGN